MRRDDVTPVTEGMAAPCSSHSWPFGVDLIVVAAPAALVLGRRRWLKKQPGEFAGAIRVANGDFHDGVQLTRLR